MNRRYEKKNSGINMSGFGLGICIFLAIIFGVEIHMCYLLVENRDDADNRLLNQVAYLEGENLYLREQLAACLGFANHTMHPGQDDHQTQDFQINLENDLDLDQVIQMVLVREGCYSYDPNDLGGETIYGIARRKMPKHPIFVNLDDLKKSLAKVNKCKVSQIRGSMITAAIRDNDSFANIARDHYLGQFKTLKLHKLESMSLAQLLFDTAINNGPYYTRQMWRIALNSLNHRSRLGKDIPMDVEYPSLDSLVQMTNKAIDKGLEGKLYQIIKHLRGARFVEISASRPKNRKFLRGWLARLDQF